MTNEFEYNDLSDISKGATLAHLAVEKRDLDYLNRVDIDKLLDTDVDGETPLHYAAVNSDIEICKLLISRNPTITWIKDIENKTAYDWVREYNEEYNSHIDLCDYFKNINI